MKTNIAIIGAGTAGSSLVRELLKSNQSKYNIRCIVDDDDQKNGMHINGIKVLNGTGKIINIIRKYKVEKVIIAIPSASPKLIMGIIKKLNSKNIDHLTLPSVSQILDGKVRLDLLRHVEPQDLLGRDPVALDDSAIGDLIRAKSVLITGAGGSIGSELTIQVARYNPKRIIIFDHSEPAAYSIYQKIKYNISESKINVVVGTVVDSRLVSDVMKKHSPDIIFHAAAYKHVPLMEDQPTEALLNNAFGTYVIAESAVKHRVEKMVLVSTDKAVNPTSVMGASKRIAEMILTEFHHSSHITTKFCSVRFGNVLGSSGSVVPIFHEQINRGGPVTVTHPEMTRYFMSIPEAVGLILQSASLSNGGEIFVLDMGNPVRIIDLASQMIELSGGIPGRDIKIKLTGLRPGEKLYEEPIHRTEKVDKTVHEKVLKLVRDNGTRINKKIQNLINSQKIRDARKARAFIKEVVPEYKQNLR
jgi:FlaA1/EpsC-like NDP-sugar epimerase